MLSIIAYGIWYYSSRFFPDITAFYIDLFGLFISVLGVYYAARSPADVFSWVAKIGEIVTYAAVPIGILQIGLSDYD